MPEFLFPGVFVEEVPFRAKAIEGVDTSTAGFVGPTRYGPIGGEPALLTSLADYERLYGGKERLAFAEGGDTDNYIWNAARAFFEEGGKQLYIARTFSPINANDPRSGFATAAPPNFPVRARFPGTVGNARVTLTLALGPNRLVRNVDGTVSLQGAVDRDIVWLGDAAGTGGAFRILLHDPACQTWRFGDGSEATLATLPDLQALFAATGAADVRTLTIGVTVEAGDDGLPSSQMTGLPLDPLHRIGEMGDSLFDRLADDASIPIVIDRPTRNGLDVLAALEALHDTTTPTPALQTALLDPASSPASRSILLRLTGGNDGATPTAEAYDGALKTLEAIDDIAIVAAPGSTDADTPRSRAIVAALIGHAERMRYRIAVIDSVRGQTIDAVRAFRALYDSSHAAFYYPWVRIVDPLTGKANLYPPSGFVVGLYARNDMEQGVQKAPANMVMTLATGFEQTLSQAQQDVLNQEGINCFRYFAGRGYRLWGARTMSSDPEWRYVNIRRYVAYLEHAIDRGTHWAVFEPNGEPLWAKIRSGVADFLLSEWHKVALLGDKPEKAYFVTCDRSTMTQDDLDKGRLVCLVGVAPIKPAEFVIFRIGQWTANYAA